MTTDEITTKLEDARRIKDDCIRELEGKIREQVERLAADRSNLGLSQYEDEDDYAELCPNGADEDEFVTEIFITTDGGLYFGTDRDVYGCWDFDEYVLVDLVDFLAKR